MKGGRGPSDLLARFQRSGAPEKSNEGIKGKGKISTKGKNTK